MKGFWGALLSHYSYYEIRSESGTVMHLRGIVQTATLEEFPPGSDRVEMVLRVQGVGAGQPRKIVVPFEILLHDADLNPEAIAGHGFEAEVTGAEGNRWLVTAIAFASRRILRPTE